MDHIYSWLDTQFMAANMYVYLTAAIRLLIRLLEEHDLFNAQVTTLTTEGSDRSLRIQILVEFLISSGHLCPPYGQLPDGLVITTTTNQLQKIFCCQS